LNLAARYSDYSNFGSTTNAKAGFRWKPFTDLLVRGNWSHGFRAPSVAELFTGTQLNGGGDIIDPCHPSSNSPADVLARCAAAGVPSDFVLPELTNVSNGGNPQLQPETAVTKTLGLVYSPSWAPGLDLYLDWYDITIDGLISDLDAQTIVNRCYVLADPTACARITRNADHQLFLVNATLQNVRTGLETEGFDFTLSWRHLTPYGRFEVRWDTAYVDYFGDKGRPARLTRLPDGTVLLGNVVATRDDFGNDEWRIKSNLTLGWSRGDWSASVTGRYFSQLEEDCQREVDFADSRGAPQYRALCTDPNRIVDRDGDGIGDPAAIHTIPAVWFFDLQAGWDAPWHAHVTAGVHNVFDRDPPISRTSMNSILPTYDIPGRFWYVEYTQHF
jgi:iron complex outermembrane receptor protein